VSEIWKAWNYQTIDHLRCRGLILAGLILGSGRLFMRGMADEVLRALSSQFDRMYASEGRPSIAPEKLLRAQLFQMLYSIRSERLLMEEIDYSILFRGFCRTELGRRNLGCDRIHQEPGPLAGS
jgi:hypothetical protein